MWFAVVSQTVTASEAVSSARPIAAQTVHKGRVWLLLGGGAAVLFGSTVVVENNEQFFPAISKANKAMKRSRETREVGLSTLLNAAKISAFLS